MSCDVRGANCASVYEYQREMARELSLEFGCKSPLRELLGLLPFDVKSSDLIAAKFIPKHGVGHIQEELVLLSVRFKEFTLSHELLLRYLVIHLSRVLVLSQKTILTRLS